MKYVSDVIAIVNEFINDKKSFTAFDVTEALRHRFPADKIFHNQIKKDIHNLISIEFSSTIKREAKCLKDITGNLDDIDTFIFEYSPIVSDSDDSSNDIVDNITLYRNIREDGRLEIPIKMLSNASGSKYAYFEYSKGIATIYFNCADCYSSVSFESIPFDSNGRLRIPAKYMQDFDVVPGMTMEIEYTKTLGFNGYIEITKA